MNAAPTYRISIDAMGGDYGLKTTIPASISALKQHSNLEISLVGVTEHIKQFLSTHYKHYDYNRLNIVHASEIVAMDEPPVSALRNKKDSSMRIVTRMEYGST